MTEVTEDDDFLVKLNYLVTIATELIDSIYVSRVEVDEIIDETKFEADKSIPLKRDVIDIKNLAFDSIDSILQTLDEIVKKVYGDIASIQSKAGMVPISNVFGFIDYLYIDPITIPLSDYYVPLRKDLSIEIGTGSPIQMDVSQAQDGSMPIDVPDKFILDIIGDEIITENGLEITKEIKPILNDSGMTIVAELGDIEFMPNNPMGWVANFDGERTYMEIPEWKTRWDFEINCEVKGVGAFWSLYAVDVGLFPFLWLKTNGDVSYYRKDDPANKPFLTVSNTDVDKVRKIVLKRIGNELTLIVDGDSDEAMFESEEDSYHGLNRLGYGFKTVDFFEGQFYNLNLIDHFNPENSRYHSGILYSYIEPRSRILVNHKTDNNGTMINFPNTGAYVETNTRLVIPANPDLVVEWVLNYNGVRTHLKIAEWNVVNGIVEFDILHTGELHPNNYIFEGRSADDINQGYFNIKDDLLPQTEGVSNLTGNFIKDKVSHFSMNYSGKINIIGAKYDLSIENCWIGQITNFKLSDPNDVDNSRFYQGSIFAYINPESDEVQIPTDIVMKDEWYKEGSSDIPTHGILNDFSIIEPLVPILGDREEYTGKRNDAGFVNGIFVGIYDNEKDIVWLSSLAGNSDIEGTYKNQVEERMPVESLLLSNGFYLIVIETIEESDNDTIHSRILNGSIDEIKRAFRYPNVFKVIKPNDPDYKGYIEEEK